MCSKKYQRNSIGINKTGDKICLPPVLIKQHKIMITKNQINFWFVLKRLLLLYNQF